MLKPELRYAFDMNDYWSLLNRDVSDQEEGQSSSKEDTTSLSTARFDDAFGQHGTTAVPKAHRHVEECSLVETLDQVRQYLLGQLEKPPQSHVMSSRRQPRKDYYSRQGDMPDTFQKIHKPNLANFKKSRRRTVVTAWARRQKKFTDIVWQLCGEAKADTKKGSSRTTTTIPSVRRGDCCRKFPRIPSALFNQRAKKWRGWTGFGSRIAEKWPF